jgi:hypothetical protein
MDHSPLLKEILAKLVTPRFDFSSPAVQDELIAKLLSASASDLTSHSGPPADCLRSLLLLQAGEFERSHSIVQEMTGLEAAYIHGMIHRVEGDYSNAKYWFRQAQRNTPPTSIDPIELTEAVAKTDPRHPDAAVVERLQTEFDDLLRSLG